ncbi:MAG TPA: hypothetical protein VM734_35240 [Kofleriaceae bacterium]|nr:hypothetical protein [Kofleriaceae bacterium]
MTDDPASRASAERARLEGYIANSRRVRRRLAVGLGVATPVAIGTIFVDRTLGFFAMLLVASVAVCGFWITWGHISDWRGRLAELDRKARPPSTRRR